MRLAKESGGTSLVHQGKTYTWKADGDIIQVPVALGQELLSIRGGGYSEARDEPVTEPAPPARAAVTEPAPAAKTAVTEGKPAK